MYGVGTFPHILWVIADLAAANHKREKKMKLFEKKG